jgi:hypothetical protein
MRIVLIALSLMLVSCEITKPVDPHGIELNNESKYYNQQYQVYTLEGCEYVVAGVGDGRWGSHKGNCKNPIHAKGL